MSLPGRVGRGRLRSRLVLLPLSALLAHGCAATAVPPAPSQPSARTTARARPRPGYDRRVDALSAVDTSALRGRRIALDPGHGGFFRGALGVNGLTEAEVNLGVALNLCGLLEARGAVVFMTRTDDRDFLTPADSSLRADLAERTRLANAFGPELFVSIHHNADARGAHDVNETQTYYKLGDEGPSLDAAQSVHRFLVRNLGIERHRILPGNYFVLRNSEAPGILTESSYLTNPDVESKLALAAKQRLEAEALYLGLAHYFARPAPSIEAFVARAGAGAAPDTVFDRIAAPLLSARVSGAFDDAQLRLDGALLPGRREGNQLTWTPAPLVAGRHEATLSVGLAGAGTSREASCAFRIRRPAEVVRGAQAGVYAGSTGGVAAVRLELFDGAGQVARESTLVALSVANANPGISPRETTIVSTDGVGWAYFRVRPGRAGGVNASIVGATKARTRARPTPVSLSPGEIRSRGLTGFALEMPSGAALRNALGTREPRDPGAWINRDGFAVCARDSAGHPIVPTLPGYRPWPSDSIWPPRLTAIAGGALHGRRIVLDPDGGGDADGGTGPSGTRAANLNLEVARALGGFLEAAGAEVRLTRAGDFALSDVERVQISEAFHADRFLRIGHRAEPPMLGYYFSSAAGRHWAETTAATLGSLGLSAPRPTEDAQYPLQQTSCPALYVSTARVDDPASEERMGKPAAIRAEAYALYLALAREWNDGAGWAADSIAVRDPEGRPAQGASVTLGGGLVLLTDERGIARYVRTEPGPIEVQVEHARVHERRVLLDSSSGVTVTGSRRP